MKGSRGKKPPYISSVLMKKLNMVTEKGGKPEIKTYDRRSTIIPQLVGFTMLVYNGKNFIPFFVGEEKVGHKIGEFVPTRIFKAHGGDKQMRNKTGGKKKK